jgi:hypothetical protein
VESEIKITVANGGSAPGSDRCEIFPEQDLRLLKRSQVEENIESLPRELLQGKASEHRPVNCGESKKAA